MTELPENVKKAMKLVEIAHDGQFRKDGKTPFFTHPVAVMENVLKYFPDAGERTLISALAHDTVEDIEDFDLDAFIDEIYGDDSDKNYGAKHDIKESVLALTKNNTISGRHEKNVENYHRIGLNIHAIKIKLCDRLHNVSDMNGMTDPFKRRYLAETQFMLGYFYESVSYLTKYHKLYNDLVKLTEKRQTELFK
jgi:(p)ppGpp synthase/HD superfamily hydrolase